MSELKIMSHLGQHGNIVNLLGACTHGGEGSWWASGPVVSQPLWCLRAQGHLLPSSPYLLQVVVGSLPQHSSSS